jgi:sugar phosphate isomerase/epimerase
MLYPNTTPMRVTCQSRRDFVRVASSVTLALAGSPSLLTAAHFEASGNPPQSSGVGETRVNPAPVMQIGVLLGTFSRGTLAERLDAVKASGLDCVQLSFDCVGMPAMPDEIPSEVTGRIRREAGIRGISIASVEGTFNMSHPDAEHRQAGLRRLRVLAQACRELGTSKIHVCTGTRDRDSMWRRHPDNNSPAAWRDMVLCVREASEIARQSEVVLGFEPEVNNVVDSAQKARRLLDEIGSPHLKVTIDGANIFHAGELPRMKEILAEAFALLGKDIVLAHAKDLDHDGDAGHLAAGQGKLDYHQYLSLLHACGFKGPLLLHGLREAQVPGCVAFLRERLAALASAPPRREG